MGYMYDDFYEPSEFEEQIEGLKQILYASVKGDVKHEIESLRLANESLRQENKELQDVKLHIRELEHEYATKLREAEQKAMRARYDEIIEACAITYWKPQEKYNEQPKCDKCDQYRYIKYTTPLGREAKEPCLCATKIVRYEPDPCYVAEIRGRNGTFTIWHRPLHDDGYSFCTLVESEWICDDKDFADIKPHYAYFKSEDNCRAYCDYLNTIEIEKEEMNG